MKKAFSLTLVLGLAFNLLAQNYQVKQSDYSQVRISFSTPEVNVTGVNILGNSFTELSLDGFSSQTAVGMPALPTLVKNIEVPLGEGLTYTIESMRCDTIAGSVYGLKSAIVPAQPSRSKSDTSRATLKIDNATYSKNAFCGAPTIELEAIGVARNRNLATIKFNPISWNPVTNQLIVVKSLTVSVKQKNADIAATRKMQQLYASPAFNSSTGVINSIGSKDNYTNAPLRYTIVAHSQFRGALDEFANWKRRQGFLVDLVYTDEANVGSTTTSIKNYLQGLYNNASAEAPAPTYVLFVGDVAQVPAFVMTAYGESQHSDLGYCCWTGNDYLPDCYYGRFSAQNLTQLNPQISKTLMYEQYTFPNPSYLSTAALIAGVDGGYSGDNGYKYGDPAMDYVAKTYVTSANGFTNIVYYKNNTSFAPTGVTVTGSSQNNTTASALRTLYNNGCGFVNYTAHGGTTDWSNPNFSNTNVGQMTNNNKPMVMIGNCCLTNSFQIDACFGEALLRKGNNAGAVGYIGGSNSTYWTEDFYWSVGIRTGITNTMNTNYDANNLGMYDRLFHSHGEAYSKWYFTMGAMIQAGNMAVQASSTSSSMKEYYWQIYHLMGDPSLMPYYHGVPSAMNVNVPTILTVGSSDISINAVPYAYIGFTDANHNLIASAFADANGSATLQFPALNTVDTCEIVITAQGYQPFIQNIAIIANGPYVNTTSMTPRATLNADGDISFDVTLRNSGVETASTLSIEFQNTDGSILLDTTGIINLGAGLQPGEELTLNNVCHGHIWGNTADQTGAIIKAIVRWGTTVNDISYNSFHFTVNADNMRMNSYDVDSSVSGSITITINNRNFGHATLQHGTISLLPLDQLLTVTSPQNQEFDIANIQAGGESTVSFTLALNGERPESRLIPLIQVIDNTFRSNKDTIWLLFGRDNRIITFEDNSWGSYPWNQGTYPWQNVAQGAYQGSRCLRSGNCGNGNSSELSIIWTSTIDDSITFYRNVSSENNYDWFKFYIDGQQMEQVSGTDNEWTRRAFYVPQGTHTFKFSYEKDGSVSSGSDCAWIDNLHLPLSGTNYIYLLDSICQGSEYQFRDSLISTEGFDAGIHHFVDSSETAVYSLTLVLTPTPQITITGGDVTIRKGETVRLTAEGAENYIWSSGETSSIIDVYPTETTTYTVTGYNGACSSTASTTITVDGTIGIDEQMGKADIRVYPNPAQSTLTIDGEGINRIVVIDVTGRTAMDKNVEGTRNSIDVTPLNDGVYFLQAFDSNGNKTTLKFVKKK